MLSSSQLNRYLDHLNLSGQALQPSLATLAALQGRHIKLLPFFNVSTARGPPYLTNLGFPRASPDLSSDGLIDKLLQRRWYARLSICKSPPKKLMTFAKADAELHRLFLACRGGYCFEHNGLMAKVLKALGFHQYCAAARVVRESTDQKACSCPST